MIRRADAPGLPGDRAASADAPVAVPTEARAPALPAGLLDEDEAILYWGRPSLLFVPLTCAFGLASIGAGACFLAWLARTAPWTAWTDVQAFALGLALGGMRLGWQWLEWLGRVHVLTDRRIVTRSGVLRVVVFQAPLRRLQHTSLFVRVRERCFGLGTIALATAGSDSFESFWSMVRRPVEVHRRILDAVGRYGR